MKISAIILSMLLTGTFAFAMHEKTAAEGSVMQDQKIEKKKGKKHNKHSKHGKEKKEDSAEASQ